MRKATALGAAVVCVLGAAAVAALALLAVWWTQRGPEPGESPSVAESVGASRKMIVVLPFENLGPVEDEYFAAGMTEEITSRLAVVSDLVLQSQQNTILLIAAFKL